MYRSPGAVDRAIESSNKAARRRAAGLSSFEFTTTCVNSTGPLINAMQEAAKEVSYRTMRKHVGGPMVEMEQQLGYDVGHKRETGLRMSKDWHVSYWRSTYDGRPCFYFVWSHIEHIFCEVE